MEAKASRTLSKKRYYEIEEALIKEGFDSELIEKAMKTIREVMNFDPNYNTYKDIKDKLKKKREEGISSYEALNQRKYYNEHKVELNKKRYELQKKAAIAMRT